MKAIRSHQFSIIAVTLSVQCAMLATFFTPLTARADDDKTTDASASAKPTSTLSLGAEYVPINSAKFGEYNGLDQRGTHLIGNFDYRGGDSYNAVNGGGGTKRFELKGTDIGTTSRAFSLDESDQGKWSFGLNFDQLRHNFTNTYQTPFQGTMGGNSFTLPPDFGKIQASAVGQLAVPGSNNLTPAQLSAFNTPNVYSQRENSKFSSKFVFDTQWNVKFDFNHLQQSGAKLQGVAGDSSNGTNATAETPFVLMTPTNYTTDTINLALNWAGEKGYATTRYYGSYFKDAYSDVYFQNPFTTVAPAGAIPTDMISTMPANEYNQFKLNGGYIFSASTKFVGGISYARNTQNSAFGQDATYPGVLPQTSLQGLINTTNADLKLTNKISKDLQLSAGLKYNKRDNQTSSNAYAFNVIANATAPVTTLNNTVSAPMSNSKSQLDMDGDYRIDSQQKVNLNYGYEEIKRWCNNVNYPLISPKQTTFPGYPSYTATTCAEVPVSNESKFNATYNLRATDSLNLDAGLGYSNRVAEINPFFYSPMQTTGASTTPGVGSGIEFQQFMSFMDASRREDLAKLGANWQVNDSLSFGFKGDYTFDKYGSEYGVQNGKSYSLNLDATYAATEHSTFSAYASSQNRTRDLTNLQSIASKAAVSAGLTSTGSVTAGTIAAPANASWTNTLTENDLTIGIGAKQGGLIAEKLDLSADVTYSLNKSTYDTELNYTGLSGNGLSCSSPSFMTCGALPDIKSDLLQLKLVGTYKIDKDRKLRAGYLFRRLNATDYMYNTYQYGSTPATLMPTNQQAPNYAVNVFSVAYDISY